MNDETREQVKEVAQRADTLGFLAAFTAVTGVSLDPALDAVEEREKGVEYGPAMLNVFKTIDEHSDPDHGPFGHHVCTDWDWYNPDLHSEDPMDEVLACTECGCVKWTAREIAHTPEAA